MKPSPDPTTIFRIARYYYETGLSQDEIAQREGFSRSQVSRLVEKARAMGMVRIELVPPTGTVAEGYAARIEEAYGLGKVIVAPKGAAKNPDGASLARSIATAAVDFIADAVRASAAVGIGWGRSVYSLASQMPYYDPPGERHFIPLLGTSGDDEPNLQINTIVDRLSSRFRGHGHFVNTPAVREKVGARTRIEEERIAVLRSLWNSVDMAIVGLGVPPNPASRYLEEFPPAYREELYASGAVGDMLGQFFLADGTVVDFAEGYEHLAFDLSRLPSLDRVVCLAGGPDKAAGIAAAAKASYITDLVTDEATAEALCDGLDGASRRQDR